MMSMTRSRTARCLGALIGAAALVAALPAPALAKDRHHDDRGHRHGRDCDHGRGHGYAWRHDRHDHGRRHASYGARHFRGGHRQHAPAYYCGRCRTHFGSYHGLYGHVHHHHRVPSWRVPGVLAQVSFGWAFGF